MGCTYHNDEGNAICKICQTPKPEPSAPQKPASPRPSAPKKPASPKAQNSTPKDLPPYYPPGWEERIDASSGRKYYVNLKTNSISWKNPNPASSRPSAPQKPASPKSKAQQTPPGPPGPQGDIGLPSGWGSTLNASGRRIYYKESDPLTSATWDHPSDPKPTAPMKPASSKPSSSGLSVFMGSDSPRARPKRPSNNRWPSIGSFCG